MSDVLYEDHYAGDIYCNRNSIVTGCVEGNLLLGEVFSPEDRNGDVHSVKVLVDGTVTGRIDKNPLAECCLKQTIIVGSKGRVGLIGTRSAVPPMFVIVAGEVDEVRAYYLILRKGYKISRALACYVFFEEGAERMEVINPYSRLCKELTKNPVF